jgi:hypothetical protein
MSGDQMEFPGLFFLAEVKDIQDPDRAGKIKIIVHVLHNGAEEPMPDEDLPWAIPIMNNSPSLNKIGSTSNYLPGTTVLCMWADPFEKQIPLILGSIHRAGLSS